MTSKQSFSGKESLIRVNGTQIPNARHRACSETPVPAIGSTDELVMRAPVACVCKESELSPVSQEMALLP